MISHYNLKYKDDLRLDLHLPDGEEFDLFVYFHGGGLTGGKHSGAEVFARTLAERGFATASVEYRLYPDAKFPEFIEDGAESIAWLKAHIADFGQCNRIFVGGSSAVLSAPDEKTVITTAKTAGRNASLPHFYTTAQKYSTISSGVSFIPLSIHHFKVPTKVVVMWLFQTVICYTKIYFVSM